MIGCRVLTQPFFWPELLWIPVPDSFARNIVRGKSYSTDTSEGMALWERVNEHFLAEPTPVAETRPGMASHGS